MTTIVYDKHCKMVILLKLLLKRFVNYHIKIIHSLLETENHLMGFLGRDASTMKSKSKGKETGLIARNRKH